MNKQDRFSRIGFILAAAGSAVGLVNIWKFPYITGDNGGGVFVLIYLLTVIFIGVAVFMGEVLLGINAHKDPVSTYENLAPEKSKKYWKFAGFTFLTAAIILTFYTVVIGWILHYIVISLTSLPATIKEAEDAFTNLLTQQVWKQIFYFTIAFAFIAYTVSKGVKRGIEKINNILMPLLLLILGILLIYAMQLDGFLQAVSFMFSPDMTKFDSESVILAVGHAFFTLSIGMTVIMTYAASSSSDINIAKTSVIIVVIDTLIAIVAGLIIFSIIFSAGLEPGKGAGLVFITLPAVFYGMGPIGAVLSIVFFIALFFAAITSAISTVEPATEYLIERKNFSRGKATMTVIGTAYAIGLVVLLSNIEGFSAYLSFAGKSLFDWFDFTSSAILLPLGGIIAAIFVGYFVDKSILEKALVPHIGNGLYKVWLFSVRVIAPVSIFFVMLFEAGVIKF